MKRQYISDAVADIDSEIIEKAADYKIKSRPWVRWTSIAACLCVAFAAAVMLMPKSEPNTDTSLPELTPPVITDSNKATVVYGDDNILITTSVSDLMELTEKELFGDYFGRENMYFFRGTVTKLENITVDFGGIKDYRCVATVKIGRSYDKKLSQNEEIKILLPCPVLDGSWVEDTDVISKIKVGMEGIFTPKVCGEGSYRKQNEKVFMYSDVADCYLSDGERWAFLQTENGLAFFGHDYKGAKDAEALDDIEQYLIKMLK